MHKITYRVHVLIGRFKIFRPLMPSRPQHGQLSLANIDRHDFIHWLLLKVVSGRSKIIFHTFICSVCKMSLFEL